jgi:YidC/Oxa1 family membrane protein insertase
MNRNTIIGLLLIFAIFIIYSYLMTPSKDEVQTARRKSDSLYQVHEHKRDSTIKTLARQQALQAAAERQKIEASGKKIDSLILLRMTKKDEMGIFANASFGKDTLFILENDVMRIWISALGGKVNRVELKKYKTWDQRPLLLLDNDSLNFGFSFFHNNRIINTDRLFFQPVLQEMQENLPNMNHVAGSDSITFSLRLFTDSGDTAFNTSQYIEFKYTLYGDRYIFRFEIHFQELEQVMDPATKFLVLNWNDHLKRQEKSLKMERMNSSIYFKYDEDKVDYLSETEDEEQYLRNEKIKWFAFKQQFFTSTLIADQYFTEPRFRTSTPSGEHSYMKGMFAEAGIPFDPKEQQMVGMRFYFGPNKFYTLKQYKVDLEKQIPLGWSFFLMAWINIYAVIPVFTFFGNLGWNYGIIILILTILLKIVLFPIAYKTYKSSAKMRILKPDIEELSKRYPKKEDALKKQQATMDLYKRAGVNPMAGCIPLLLQMPILIAMFRFFPSSIELRQQAFLWAKDLSSYDAIWTFPGGFSIPFYGDHISLFALLMTISSIIYTRINDQMMGSTQQQMPGMKTMMYLMPVMFLFWFNDYSSGLSYYYLLANLLTFAQIYLIRATIDEKKLHSQIEANRKKPVKKSGFQKRLEDMAKKRGYPVKR